MTIRRFTIWLLLLAVIAALQVVDVSVAQASCGDYLIHGGSRMQAHEPLSLLIPNAPCRGPGCQKAPSNPFLPQPARLTPPETERLGCLSGSPLLSAVSRTALVARFAEQPNAGYLLTIEHPPRETH